MIVVPEEINSRGSGVSTNSVNNFFFVFEISISKELGLSSLLWSCFRQNNFGFFQ